MRRKCTDTLIQWKKNPHRKPLLLQGMRQTGKTWLLRDFGSRRYETAVYINLETDRPAARCLSQTAEPEDVLLFLETYTGKKLRTPDTLLILDNIQSVRLCSRSILYDLWDFSSCDIAAAERGFSEAPASSELDVLRLYPLDFEEFLWANSEFGLSREIRNHFSGRAPMGKELHEKALAQFRLYLAIGGMPEAVLEYRREKSLLTVPDVQQKLLTLLQADIVSRAPEELSRHCLNCWQSIAAQLGKEGGRFRYRPVTKSGSARLYQEPIRWLTDSGFALYAPRRTDFPDGFDPSAFRLYFPDAGLAACQLRIPAYLLLSGEETQSARSCVETFLAQQFAGNGYALSYWHSGGRAEVPFLLEKNGGVTAVDYRLSPEQKSRSLTRLRESAPAAKSILLSAEDFRTKEAYEVIPFYAVFCI